MKLPGYDRDADGNETERYKQIQGTCPWMEVSDFAMECGRLLAHYRNGLLYRPGGIEDQPLAYMEAMRLMDNEFKRIEREDMESQAKKQKGHRG